MKTTDPDFTQQAETVIAELRQVLSQVHGETISAAAEKIATAPRLFCAGAGRSNLLMQMFAMRLAQTGCETFVVGQPVTPAITSEDLLIILSGSGETSTMRAIADKGAQAGAALLAITYSPESSLAKRAQIVVELPVALDPNRPGGLAGTQILGSLFDQCFLIAGDIVTQEVKKLRRQTEEDLARRHANLE